MNNNDNNKNTSVKQVSEDAASKVNVIEKIKSIKNFEIIVAVIAVILMLIIYFSSQISFESEDSSDTLLEQLQDYCSEMESKLTTSLSTVDGCGDSIVIINWESSVEKIIAYATSANGDSTTMTPEIITSSGDQSPIVLVELYPKALGVIIICQGGDSVAVKIQIIEAVSVLLDIEASKISVLKMES